MAGWADQWLVHLSVARDSWTAPRDVRRVHPREHAHTVAVEQITALIAQQPVSAATPLFVFDAGSDAAHLTQALADTAGAIVVRLRADRCCSADPPPSPPSPTGGTAAPAWSQVWREGSDDLACADCRARDPG